jgi:anti-sigma regulatory factor (Ser/Thr protein kinase)
MGVSSDSGGNAKDMTSIAMPPARMLVALPLRPEACRIARKEIRACALSDDIAHTAQLLVTELVANSVRHAEMDPEIGQILLFGRVGRDHLRIEVADTGDGFDPEDDAVGGLGLRLLDKLATRWGTARTDAGFRVWFEIDRRSSTRFSL